MEAYKVDPPQKRVHSGARHISAWFPIAEMTSTVLDTPATRSFDDSVLSFFANSKCMA